jgi:hypothetical protein
VQASVQIRIHNSGRQRKWDTALTRALFARLSFGAGVHFLLQLALVSRSLAPDELFNDFAVLLAIVSAVFLMKLLGVRLQLRCVWRGRAHHSPRGSGRWGSVGCRRSAGCWTGSAHDGGATPKDVGDGRCLDLLFEFSKTLFVLLVELVHKRPLEARSVLVADVNLVRL